MKTNSRGQIIVDKYQNTNVPGIYAVGDIIEGGIELTPVAVAAGRRLSERLFNNKPNEHLITISCQPSYSATRQLVRWV